MKCDGRRDSGLNGWTKGISERGMTSADVHDSDWFRRKEEIIKDGRQTNVRKISIPRSFGDSVCSEHDEETSPPAGWVQSGRK